MKEVRALLEGQKATPQVLENEGYEIKGSRFEDPVYENEHNKIIVNRDHVIYVYHEPWKNANKER